MAPVGVDRTIAANMLRLMEERGWSQERLGHEAGMPSSTVNAIVDARRNPTLRTLRRLRKAFGCTWDELLGKEGV